MPENKSTIPTDLRINECLTDSQIDEVAQFTKDVGTHQMQDLKETVEVNTDAELEKAEVLVDSNTNEIDLIAKSVEDMDLNIDIFDAADPEKIEEAAKEKIISNVKSSMDLDDDEAYEFIKIADEFRKNQNVPNLYSRLPSKIQNIIGKLMYDAKIPMSNRDQVTKMILGEFINNAEVEAAFVDFEKALNEAFDIPSMIDMYGDHTRTIMDTKIPEMIEAIKEEAPEKAELLKNVKENFDKSYSLIELREMYENNSHIRKSVRRSDICFKRSLENLNFKNSKTRFKMYDVFEMYDALVKVLSTDPANSHSKHVELGVDLSEQSKMLIDLCVTDEEIKKFCTLVACTCENLDAENIIDASYMYYLTKNIIMLKHTEESKTDFAAELINNICDIITLIRDKEAAFYAENPNLLKSKHSKKSNSASGNKK